MKPKRILHIIGRMDRAGAETMLMNLFRVINKNEIQFDFLYFTDDHCDYDNEIISLGGKIYRISNTTNALVRTIELYRFLRKEKSFYAIHSHTLFSNGLHLFASYFAYYKKRIAHSHNTSDYNDNTLLGRIYQKVTKLLINTFATKFVACGELAGQYLFYPSKEIIQLPNAVDVRLFNKCGVENRDYLRKELNLDGNCLLIIQVGRLFHVKNHEFTIKIGMILKEKNVNFHIVFAGDGELKKTLIDLCEKESIVDNISFLGVRDDIPYLLAGSDIMLMPSYHEGFPVVLVESQSVGIPTIVSTNVSKEVDLGVGKIYFGSLHDINSWIELIEGIPSRESIPGKERVSIISKKGYDINESVKILEKIYN